MTCAAVARANAHPIVVAPSLIRTSRRTCLEAHPDQPESLSHVNARVLNRIIFPGHEAAKDVGGRAQ